MELKPLCPHCLEVLCECDRRPAPVSRGGRVSHSTGERRRAHHAADASAQIEELTALGEGHVLLRRPGPPKAKKAQFAVARGDDKRTLVTRWTTKRRALEAFAEAKNPFVAPRAGGKSK
jgi:hypothetical protein